MPVQTALSRLADCAVFLLGGVLLRATGILSASDAEAGPDKLAVGSRGMDQLTLRDHTGRHRGHGVDHRTSVACVHFDWVRQS